MKFGFALSMLLLIAVPAAYAQDDARPPTAGEPVQLSTGGVTGDELHGDPVAGKELFRIKGCYSCHGYVGQGSREGPRIAPPIALPALIAQLRTPRNIMPPYEPSLISDSQAADIYAYLASLPKPPDPKTLKAFQE